MSMTYLIIIIIIIIIISSLRLNLNMSLCIFIVMVILHAFPIKTLFNINFNMAIYAKKCMKIMLKK